MEETSRPEDALIPLSDLIQAIRSDLVGAAEKRDSKFRPYFRVSGLELELSMVASQEAKGGGGLKLYVLSVGAEAKWATERSVRVRLSLEPLSQEASDKELGTQNPVMQGPDEVDGGLVASSGE